MEEEKSKFQLWYSLLGQFQIALNNFLQNVMSPLVVTKWTASLTIAHTQYIPIERQLTEGLELLAN